MQTVAIQFGRIHLNSAQHQRSAGGLGPFLCQSSFALHYGVHSVHYPLRLSVAINNVDGPTTTAPGVGAGATGDHQDGGSLGQLNSTGLLKRLTDTATEVEFHLDTFPYVHDLLGMMDQPSTAWTHATLHLAVLNSSMIHADSSVKTITRCLDLIAPALVGWMNAQHDHNMATTEMKVYAHLEHDVLPNITNEDLAILLPHAVQLWNDEQYAAVRLWLQSHDILRLVRGPLTPWG